MTNELYCINCGKYIYSGTLCKRCTNWQMMADISCQSCSDKEKVLQYCKYRYNQIDSDEIKAMYNDMMDFVGRL